MKWNHLKEEKLHLNKKGTELISDIFVKELSTFSNWQNIDKSKQSDVCDFDDNFMLRVQMIVKGF